MDREKLITALFVLQLMHTDAAMRFSRDEIEAIEVAIDVIAERLGE